MSSVRLVAVFSENKPGQLARATKVLADAAINIHWVGIADAAAFGVVRFLVDRTEPARQHLNENGFMVSLVEVIAAEVPDRPGSLHGVVSVLAQQGIGIANCSGFVFNQRAILLLETSELTRARQVLADNHLHLLTEAELLKL
jgi:hypothetical protein